jgi:tRNA (guanine37-N1)-methyltransferase
MQIEILTIFPEYFRSPLAESLLGKAIAADRIRVAVTDLRDFAEGRHRKVDDEPYGGGAGMVMMVPVLAAAVEARKHPEGSPVAWTVLLTPDGRPLDQRLVEELASRERILLVCGRYEGIDERARALVDRELSIGDYVVTGGELPALVVIDAVARLVPGVIDPASHEDDSFATGLLEYPQYTRPEEFRGERVPEVLLSGHHGEVDRWRRREALRRTLERRPDLLPRAPLTDVDRAELERIRQELREDPGTDR